MCGIVGYVGAGSAAEIVINGLKRLEYRGYDSAGLAIPADKMIIKKKSGKISNLESEINYDELSKFHTAIAHTRWATHGAPSDINAHPHTCCNNKIAVVHNGIIENHTALRKMLELKGHQFISQTDTEVLAHLIERHYVNGRLLDSVMMALAHVEGTFGIAVICIDEPGKIIAARRGSPLLLGVGKNGMIVASDAGAIVEYTRKVIYLEDGEMAEVKTDGFRTFDLEKNKLEKEIIDVSWDIKQIEKQGYQHFMLKEIFEQPETVKNAFRGRNLSDIGDVRLNGLNLSQKEINEIERIIFIACGTSWHAGLIGEYMIEEHARIPVEVEYASEFRYRKPILKKSDLVIFISQSGETADTIAALREAKSKGAKVMGITNVVGSTIARETGQGIFIHAGPEIGVASTKAFTAQVTVLILLTIFLARRKDMTNDEAASDLESLSQAPGLIEKILANHELIKKIAEEYKESRNFIYLGRGYQFPVALEGALKLKEISYIHAEGYPAAEMKHGPIALIDKDMPVVFIAINDEVYDKVLSNMQEVKARSGKIIAILFEGDEVASKLADHVIFIPKARKMIAPLLTVIPLQLLAYYIAVLRGCDVDQPRNLAKSVTVE